MSTKHQFRVLTFLSLYEEGNIIQLGQVKLWSFNSFKDTFITDVSLKANIERFLVQYVTNDADRLTLDVTVISLESPRFC